jgi:hypothetical protein
LNIRSMRDLEMARLKLKIELLKKEDGMKSNFQHIRHFFTLSNLLQTGLTEVANRGTTFSKAVEIGRNLFSRKKKKKKKGEDQENQHQQPDPAGGDPVQGD